jgi:type VI secretion system protein ImpM
LGIIVITHGFFGKLPTMGDFVGRGWLNSMREGLDKLLQEAFRELLQSSPDGKQAILAAPCVVLSIRPGVIDEQGLEAVLLPSQDRVGRIFPLCAGVQWTEDGQGGMGWPSLDYTRSLIATVQRCLDAEVDPDVLLSEIAALGSPRQYRQTFTGLGEDETLPRLSSQTKLLRIQASLAATEPALRGLCSMLTEASDLLGIRLDAVGGAMDFCACRRVKSGAELAALFDGCWAKYGWTSYEAPPPSVQANVEAAPEVDPDATKPRVRAIDIDALALNSLNHP